MDKIAFMVKHAVVEQPLEDLVEETLELLFDDIELKEDFNLSKVLKKVEEKIGRAVILNYFGLNTDACMFKYREYQLLDYLEPTDKKEGRLEADIRLKLKKIDMLRDVISGLYLDNREALYNHFREIQENLKNNSDLLREVLTKPSGYPGIERLIDIKATKGKLAEMV